MRRNLQIIKNSQTKCVKDEWFKSSLVFDTISLKQIPPLTQSLWCFETHGYLLPRIKWSTTRKWSTQGCALRITQCLFLSLWHKMKMHKIFSPGEFFWKSSFYEWTMKNYTLLNRHSVSVITDMHRLTDSKNKIIKYYYLEK